MTVEQQTIPSAVFGNLATDVDWNLHASFMFVFLHEIQ